MFFAKWIAPSVLVICGLYMIKMSAAWFKSGRPFKGAMDLLAGVGFVAAAFSIPFMISQ